MKNSKFFCLVSKGKTFALISLLGITSLSSFSPDKKNLKAENESSTISESRSLPLVEKQLHSYAPAAHRTELYLPMLKGKKVAVMANQTSTLSDKTHLVDFLKKEGINVVKIFSPEHGFRGNADAGEHIKNGIDYRTGFPIVSLYGKNRKPSPSQISDIDVILFDIQDVGVRFYTYISSLTYLMEAAAENNKEIIVLDRPNPHDGYTAGPVLDLDYKSFVGMHPVPVVYGLTIGEYGHMVNGEGWLSGKKKAKYTLIPMMGYHKKKRYPITERPSPNLPNDISIRLYPSLCFFEGTQVSVGRGTDFPFQIYGSPLLKKMPFQFTPQPNLGAKDPFLKGKLCYGEDLRKINPPTTLDLKYIIRAYQAWSGKKEDFFLKNKWFDTLTGTDKTRKQILEGKTSEEIQASWEADLKKFEHIRKKYIIYPD